MHIVLVSSQHHPTHGGIGAYIHQFATACAEADWRCELITRPTSSELRPVATKVHEVFTGDMDIGFEHRIAALRKLERIRPYRYGLWSLAVAQRLLEMDGQPDVIEFVDCQAEGFVSLTSRRVRERFAKTLMTVSAHTPMWLHEQHAAADVNRFGRSIYHAWERSAVDAADGVIAPSRGLLERLEPGSPATSVPLPLPMALTDAFEPSESQMILCIGAVQPQKGVDVWARSLNRVLLTKPKATAVLIGADTPTAPDGLSMAAHVQRLIDRRVIDRFRWMGALPHEHVRRFIQEAALVVVPSVFESFSFAAAEALMCGRPVIVSEDVGLREHVPGLPVAPAGDADAWTEAQLLVLKDLGAAHERARELRVVLIDKCSAANVIEQRARHYEQLRPRGESAASRDGADAMEKMSDWLRSVEAAEAAMAQPAASLAVSA